MSIESDFLARYNNDELKNIPHFIEMNKDLYDDICKKYNGLHNICRELNIKPPPTTRKTKDEVITELYRLNKKYGYVSKPMVEKHSYINYKVIIRMFGSFSNMYDNLNIPRHPSGYIPTSKELLEDFKNVYNKFGHISRDIINTESKYSYTCYSDRFGNLNNIRKKLNIPIVVPGECQKAFYTIKKYEMYFKENAIKEKTFPWLKNPATDHLLRIDAFFPKHNIALEYNGPQHYKVDNRYSKTVEELKYRQHLDNLKISLLNDHNIKTIVVSYLDRVNRDYIEKSVGITNLLN